MNKIKKITSFMLAFILLFSLSTVSVFAEESTNTSLLDTQEFQTSFVQKEITTSGQYEMHFSGYISMDSKSEGYFVLTPRGIALQNINIHVKNTVTGEIETLTESNIESIFLEISYQKITLIVLTGSVQTPKGTLESYVVGVTP